MFLPVEYVMRARLWRGAGAVSENPQPGASPNTPDSPDAGQDVTPARATRLSDIVVGHLADQARRTA
jgi:hypothetical protein